MSNTSPPSPLGLVTTEHTDAAHTDTAHVNTEHTNTEHTNTEHTNTDSPSPSWWDASLSRRDLHRASLGLAAIIGVGGGSSLISGCTCNSDDSYSETVTTTKTVEANAIDIQKEQGWDVDSDTEALRYTYGNANNDFMGIDRKTVLERYSKNNNPALIEALQPVQGTWKTFAKMTLPQVLSQNTKNIDRLLKDQLNLVSNEKTQEAYDKGAAIAALVANSQDAGKTLIVVDLPGPEAVALAAGMADQVDPVFQFDHWPHPKGVVPGHETLGALLYYASDFSQKRAKRLEALSAPPKPAGAAPTDPPTDPPTEPKPADATPPTTPTPTDTTAAAPVTAPATNSLPVALIFDSRRLSPFTDAEKQFDNRYLAQMPSRPALKSLGVQRLLYVTSAPLDDSTGDANKESDDLNEEFADLNANGTNVANVSLDAFQIDPNAPEDVGNTSVTTTTTTTTTETRPRRNYYYGGNYHSHTYFYSHYPMFIYYPMPYYSSYWVPPARATAPAGRYSSAPKYSPKPRFSSRTTGGASGVGRSKPTGVGKVSTKRDSSGRFVGTSTSPRYKSSGSLGRSGGGSSG